MVSEPEALRVLTEQKLLPCHCVVLLKRITTLRERLCDY